MVQWGYAMPVLEYARMTFSRTLHGSYSLSDPGLSSNLSGTAIPSQGNLDICLCEIGKQGWNLVGIIGGDSSQPTLLFSRPQLS